jgi:hypothetical protein
MPDLPDILQRFLRDGSTVQAALDLGMFVAMLASMAITGEICKERLSLVGSVEGTGLN